MLPCASCRPVPQVSAGPAPRVRAGHTRDSASSESAAHHHRLERSCPWPRRPHAQCRFTEALLCSGWTPDPAHGRSEAASLHSQQHTAWRETEENKVMYRQSQAVTCSKEKKGDRKDIRRQTLGGVWRASDTGAESARLREWQWEGSGGHSGLHVESLTLCGFLAFSPVCMLPLFIILILDHQPVGLSRF